MERWDTYEKTKNAAQTSRNSQDPRFELKWVHMAQYKKKEAKGGVRWGRVSGWTLFFLRALQPETWPTTGWETKRRAWPPTSQNPKPKNLIKSHWDGGLVLVNSVDSPCGSIWSLGALGGAWIWIWESVRRCQRRCRRRRSRTWKDVVQTTHICFFVEYEQVLFVRNLHVLCAFEQWTLLNYWLGWL